MRKKALNKEKFEQIFPALLKASEIDFSLYKLPTLTRAIQRRMAAVKAKNMEAYINHLRKDREEGKRLSQSMLIKVTGFFRDQKVFEKLKQNVFPALIKQKKRDALRIWVPACCTGEEVYSLAIILMEYLRDHKLTVPVQIFGTDMSETALKKARTASYSEKEVRGIPKPILERYFVRIRGQYQIDKNIRGICLFARQNLIQDPPFSKIDLISCRNVLIYLGNELQEKVIKALHYALQEHGILVLGASESIKALQPNLFNPLDKNHNIYTKRAMAAKPNVSFHFAAVPLKGPPKAPKTITQTRSELDVGKEMDRILIERTEHPALLINDANEIVQTRGDLGPYLRIPSGKTTFHVLKMAKDGLAIELKMLLDKARRRPGILTKRVDFGTRKLNLEIYPLHKYLSKEHYFLILFNPADIASDKAGPAHALKPKDPKKIAYLKRELSAMKAYIQSMMDEHEAATEELKSSNEEVLSSNEELQSLNEELETAKEELESTNEELTTVNEELQIQMENLRQSEERFRLLVESVREYAIFLLDPKGRITTWNLGAERIKGYQAQEIIGQHFSKFYPLEDKQKPALELAAAAKKGVYAEEGWRIRKDGARFWASVVITALKDKSGKLTGFARVTRDMTERKQAEELLRRSEEYSRSIIETSKDAFISADSRGVITEWNKEAEIIFGWKKKEAIGRALKETIIPSRFREAHEKGMERFLKTNEGKLLYKTIELTALHHEGHEFPVELTLWPTQFDDQFNFHSFIRDITERKKTEESLRKAYDELEQRVQERTRELRQSSEELMRSNADLQQFAYIASHDLQEPLRMVSAYVDLLGEHFKGSMDSNVKDYIDFAQEGAVRAQKLIQELLEYSRIGSREVNFVPSSMEDILKHVLSLLEISIEENKALITFDPLPVLPVDRFQMEQLFQNLISNAIKYRSKNRPKIRISAKKKEGRWVFSVKDNGIGIDPKYKESIFVIFKRLHSGSEYPGTGIGLALCKKIIERHQGEIWVDSRSGVGSTFYFTLPDNKE